MNNWAVILDMDRLRYIYLKESDLNYQANLQPNGLDGLQSGYLADAGSR